MLVGVCAFLAASLCTSFASVFFEHILKHAPTGQSLWMRNIQLAILCTGIAAISLLKDAHVLAHSGLLRGCGTYCWLAIINNGAGGILVSIIILHADSIVRGFAQSSAIIIAAVGSHFIFGFQFTLHFLTGASMVALAIFLYGDKDNQLLKKLRCVSLARADMITLPRSESECQILGGGGGDELPGREDLKEAHSLAAGRPTRAY